MNKKYDFNEIDAEKILTILYPTVSAVEFNLIDLIEAMDEVGADSKRVADIAKMLEEISFLDEIENVQEHWKEIRATFFTDIMNVQIKEEMGNPYFAFMQYFQVDELFRIFDDYVLESGKRIYVDKKEILTYEEFKKSLIKRAFDVANEASELFNQDDALNIFDRQWNKVLDPKEIGEKEDEIFDFILAFEEYNSASKIENERFWGDKIVKLAYELINRTLAIVSFNSFLDEYNFQDELVEE
jgi:hypothetical protein